MRDDGGQEARHLSRKGRHRFTPPGSQTPSTDQAFARLLYLSGAVPLRTSPSDGDGLAVLSYACAHLPAASIFAARKLRDSEKEHDDDRSDLSAEFHVPLLPQRRRLRHMSNDDQGHLVPRNGSSNLRRGFRFNANPST
jgi:hypothetical protein